MVYLRHQCGPNRKEGETNEGQQPRETGYKAAAWCNDCGEEAKHIEEEAGEEEDPAETPHVEIIVARSTVITWSVCCQCIVILFKTYTYPRMSSGAPWPPPIQAAPNGRAGTGEPQFWFPSPHT